MKALRLIALGLAISLTSAYAADEVNALKVTYKNGTTVQYLTSDIVDITFRTAASDTVTINVGGHECVDMGLPSGLKWATCNLGADHPLYYGYYFGWGETTTKSTYDIFKGKWSGKTTQQLIDAGVIDAQDNLTAAYDMATELWGTDWRIPTREEWQELIDNCTWEWTDDGYWTGVTITGPNGRSIYIPAAGNYHGFRDEHGRYWSATANVADDRAWGFYFDATNHYLTLELAGTGLPIRAVTSAQGEEK